MKYRLLMVIILVGIALFLPLGGCIPQYQAEIEALTQENMALKTELEKLKANYPPRDFASLTELREWVERNDVSNKPTTEYADDWYIMALDIQADALEDGHVINVDYDVVDEEGGMLVWCTAIADGRLYYWDPETDDIWEEFAFGTLK